MADTYAELISDQDLLLLQLHGQAAAASGPEVREVTRAGYAQLVEYVRGASGGADEEVRAFFATGTLCHLIVALDAHGVDAPWTRTLAAGLRHV
jgi:hypothetical protein